MTVTQRAKIVPREEDQLNLTSGIQFNCDWCHQDITHSVRIKCAAEDCAEVDMCPSCFCKGREGGKHKAWHDYKVVEQHSYPIFDESWGADEELLLIEGLTLFGLGNWQDAAEHVGTRTKEECERHYREVWIGQGGEAEGFGGAMEDEGLGYRPDIKFDIDTDTFQQRKKRRIEDMRSQIKEIPSGSTKKPLVSAPVNHEIGGFMPGRLDFEHEVYMDDAEEKVKDMEFGLVMAYGGDEQPGEPPAPVKEESDAGSPAIAGTEAATAAPPLAPPPPPATASSDQVPLPPTGADPQPASAAATPAGTGAPSPTKMDIDDPDADAEGEDDDDDDDDFPSQPSGSKLPPPNSAAGALAAAAAPVAGQSHRGLSSGAGKKAASSKAMAAGGGPNGANETSTASKTANSKKTMHPPSSLPRHILAAQQRDRSVSESATPEPEGLASTETSPTPSTTTTAMGDKTLPPGSGSGAKTIPPGSGSATPSLLPPTPSTTPLPTATAPPPKPPGPVAPPPMNLVTDSADHPEDPDDLELKLAVLRIYNERLDRRREVKNIIFQRGLTEHKKIQAADRKRPQKERDLIQKHKVFAKLQTAEDYEVLIDGLIYEQTLRARIAQLQTYRAKGISTILDAERYESQLELRNSGIADVKVARGGAASGPAGAGIVTGGASSKRTSVGPEDHLTAAVRNQYTAATGSRKPPAPLNLASAASLHLLSPSEQALCSTLRILPKPYLMIKETLIREYVRRGGQLRRREARGLIKVDVNKTSKIWDLLSEMGCFTLDGGASASSPAGLPTPLATAASLPAEKDSVGGMDVDPALLPIESYSGTATPVAGPAAALPTLSPAPPTPAAAATLAQTPTTPSISGKTLPLTPIPPPPPMETPPPLPPSSAPEAETPMDGVVKTEEDV